jgi:2-phosphoglycerate kinase
MIVVRSKDPEDPGLPYSKGLMAQTIMGAGLGTERSFALASRIERLLVEGGQDEIRVEKLRELAEGVLAEEEGEAAVRRFRQWWRLRGLERPLVVLLGGVTGVGKSTVATQLASRLGITRVVATDQVRQVVRAFFSHDFMPAVHHSSFDVAERLSGSATENSATIAGFLRQVHDIAPGVDALVERAISERVPIVIEGVHLMPDVPDPKLCAQAITARALLAVTDPDDHRAHFHLRGTQASRSPERYLEAFDRIRAIQDYLLAGAREAGIPTVDEPGIESALVKVTEIVLDAVEAADAPDGAGGGIAGSAGTRK